MPTGPPHLCDASVTRSAAAAASRDVEPAERLRGVGVEHRAGRALADDVRDRGQRLDGADLVVDEHHRHEGDVVVERGGQRVEVDDAPPVDGHDAARRPRATGCEHGVVLDGAAHGRAAPRAEHAAHREVVGLGAAAREHDLAGLRSRRRSASSLAGVVEGGARLRARARGRPTGCRRRRAAHGTIAASASGRSGVVAAWSR